MTGTPPQAEHHARRWVPLARPARPARAVSEAPRRALACHWTCVYRVNVLRAAGPNLTGPEPLPKARPPDARGRAWSGDPQRATRSASAVPFLTTVR